MDRSTFPSQNLLNFLSLSLFLSLRGERCPFKHHKAYGQKRCRGPLILSLGTSCRWVFSLRLQPLYPREKAFLATNRTLGGRQNNSGRVWRKERILVTARIQPPKNQVLYLEKINSTKAYIYLSYVFENFFMSPVNNNTNKINVFFSQFETEF